jgi:hypothetical protein
MEIVKQAQNFSLIRLAYGEELRGEVEKFCAEKSIGAAWFNAIGATKETEIGCYNLEEKKYDTKIFLERLEIVNIIGDISLKDGKPFMHAHGTFARPSFEIIGGHIMSCVISGTCEIGLWKLDGKVGRKYDELTGLHLLCAEFT